MQVLGKRRKQGENSIRGRINKALLAVVVFVAAVLYGMPVYAAQIPGDSVSDNSTWDSSVSDNSSWNGSVSDNSVQPGDSRGDEPSGGEDADAGEGAKKDGETQEAGTEAGEAEVKEIKEETDGEKDVKDTEGTGKESGEQETAQVQAVDAGQLQTLNYKDGVLTDWQQISDALRTLSPESLANPDAGGNSLVLQVQNVAGIPAGIKDCIGPDGSGSTKYLHCNIGYGVSLVFNGSSDNSGFQGVNNTSVTVDSEKRGKKSMAVTVRFASHENFGTIAGLQINLPQCEKGTKVSVYAETVSVDADGNVTVGENACIGNTKADENGNVEVLIQSTANYMFVYKEAKD